MNDDNQVDLFAEFAGKSIEEYTLFISDPGDFKDVPYDSFAKCTLIILPHLFNFLKAYKNKDPNFKAISARCSRMLQVLKGTIKREMQIENYDSILDKIIDAINNFESDYEKNSAIISSYSSQMYCHLRIDLQRVLTAFNVMKQSQLSKSTVEIDDAINRLRQITDSQLMSTLKDFFNSDQLNDNKHSCMNDIFLLKSETAEKFNSSTKLNSVNYPHCQFCVCFPADMFCMPCGHPYCCSNCYDPEMLKDQNTCDKCKKEIESIEKANFDDE